jgi:type IV pilus assembly protein PilV
MFVKTTQSIPGSLAAKPGARRQRGDTMIEVLVTIIIIAVGVLGAAALQVTTLKNLSSSHSASVAAIVAEEFGERMLANPTAALADEYVHSTAPQAYPDCTANACTPAQLAAYDMGTWWVDLNNMLPSGRGEVTRNAGTDTFVLTVRWDEDRSGSTGTTCPPQSAADLECFRLNVTM